MSWLLTHMWMALAAVGLFALLLGWSVRGILLVGKLRTARVDRDVSRTELEQARAEIEGLYAAQRNTAPGASDPALKAELNVREKRLAELSSELARSKAELESLKTGAGRGTAASAKPAAIAADEEPSLLWRNRHLESRVRHLESALHQPAAAAAATVAGAAAVADMAPEGDAAEADKLKWQADFLKQRVEALEAELAAQPAAVAGSAQPAAEGDANEELARLRWRNRYLEGRIAYFEGDSASATEESPSDDEAGQVSVTDAILTELEEADAAADADESDLSGDDDVEYAAEADETDDAEADDEVEEDDDVPDDDDEQDDDAFSDVETEDDESDEDDDAYEDDESEDDESDDDSDDDESDDDDDDDDDDDEDSDDDEADDDDVDDEDDSEEDDDDEDDLESDEAEDEIEAERPIALEKPVADAPDDLTIIGGIGPKIQEVLNELGIFHYDQIAAWSPENIAWVDHHLNFSGRISREGWVEQAAILSGDVADE